MSVPSHYCIIVTLLISCRLMALLELCEVDQFSCNRLVICIDRHADQKDTLIKDLGWIGFSLTTLDDFAHEDELISDKWLFMDMET